MTINAPTIAIILPCFNEDAAIQHVIDSFRVALPNATVYVYDNNSTDATSAVARSAGAIVRLERRQGKGHVVRRMFSDIDADIYVLADGDGTYHAPSSVKMVELLCVENLDMVVGTRQADVDQNVYRPGHHFGNKLFTNMVGLLFGRDFTDILSGYRVMSRSFVKSFPAITKGFEIEVQLTIHALDLMLPCAEMPTPYLSRPQGGTSKLRTYRDGTRILFAILRLFKEMRPLAFFGALSVIFVSLSVALGIPIVIEYLSTGLVPRFPTAILSSGLALIAAIFFTAGVILDTVSRNHRELKRLIYNGIPSGRYQIQ